jgi:predicted unusual protein kinase regulating ubiquinone biosynthesis (AarF/ABC1/UbiB family)
MKLSESCDMITDPAPYAKQGLKLNKAVLEDGIFHADPPPGIHIFAEKACAS